MKRVLFRVDSSFEIGSGHLMRCLALAECIREGREIFFVCRDLEGNLNYLIRENKFALFELPRTILSQDLNGYEKWLTVKPTIDAKETRMMVDRLGTVDLLIVDSYAIDKTWETMLRSHAKQLMVIDDLANRHHDCDILLDQNYCKNLQKRYRGLVPQKCMLLIGPQYALLRKEFYEVRKKVRHRDGSVKNILVFFGGSDLTSETLKACSAIISLNRLDIVVNVVIGRNNPHKNEVKFLCEQYPLMNFYCQIDYMARLMNEADLAIGAGGSTTWERCYLGLPAIVIAIAENQVEISENCQEFGCIKYLGTYKEVKQEQIKICIEKFMKNPKELQNISTRGMSFAGDFDIELFLDCFIPKRNKM